MINKIIFLLFNLFISFAKISDSTGYLNSSIEKINYYKSDHLLLRNLLQNYNKKIRPMDTVQVKGIFSCFNKEIKCFKCILYLRFNLHSI